MRTRPKRRGRVILFHGFNVFDGGANTIAKLAPFFEAEGFQVLRPSYGWVFLLGLRYVNAKIIPAIAPMIVPGDKLVGHSNGCLVAAGCVDKGARADQLVLINPAMDSDRPFPVNDTLKAVHVWHSPSDSPVKWAKWLPFHPWGDMGAKGYQGRTDKRVHNYNKETGYPVSSKEHSDIFEPDKLAFFGPKIVEAVLTNSK